MDILRQSITFPYHKTLIRILPQSMSYEYGALIEPLSVAVYSAERAEVGLGSKVLVLGAGPVGLLCLLVAKAAGAASIGITGKMPRKRKSDPSLYAWDEENMKAAVMAHLKDGMPIRTAATLHAVQKLTLSRYCKAYSASADKEKVAFRFTPRYDVKKVFSSEMEDSLESYVLLSSQMNYGLTKKTDKEISLGICQGEHPEIP
ncbi:hypothetical protein QYM36_007206 [Artemia franciscana]|uniref:Sorbitol dehydrogenase n=1 Tax=Artemia franciscana TaxID=6661 RepID=A0AA88L8S9_ARTSF|nr:hypothetical protein QYM36_007206 [Artemia franciscana]